MRWRPSCRSPPLPRRLEPGTRAHRSPTYLPCSPPSFPLYKMTKSGALCLGASLFHDTPSKKTKYHRLRFLLHLFAIKHSPNVDRYENHGHRGKEKCAGHGGGISIWIVRKLGYPTSRYGKRYNHAEYGKS